MTLSLTNNKVRGLILPNAGPQFIIIITNHRQVYGRKQLNGRASASQAEGCGFDPRLPLQMKSIPRKRLRGLFVLLFKVANQGKCCYFATCPAEGVAT
jgi:hypothetical protein